ncbi:MAG: chemotaxis-specific protein-glutamate methyltransferase CheB [Lachnospiraceae bacterium]|nr:chemotaxis-specific protein-glutamate methyltransferase CheB [Lachnospiraceae bacterium]
MLKKKNILIIDDSALMRRVLSDIINSDERFIVCDVASNGLEAYDKITLNPRRYDVILLDINMPKMNGIEFMEEINRLKLKLTVIVVSTIAVEGAAETIRLLELGAFDFVTKPNSFSEAKENTFQENVLTCLACAAGFDRMDVRSKRRTEAPLLSKPKGNETTPVISVKETIERKPHKAVGKDASKLVALACSTGGPKALQQVVPRLPKNLDAPMLIVQHMPVGFTETLANRLNELSQVSVKEAADGDCLKKGTVYVAKGGSQLRVSKKGNEYVLSVTDEPARNALRPCADIMYESLLESDYDDITCVVLTGMGRDGTAGIKQLNDKRNIYVIGQEASTCTVYGMPRALYEAGLADVMLPLEEVADAITKNVGVR